MIRAAGAEIRTAIPSRNYYDIKNDSVNIAPAECFASRACYYNSMFHELAHWTGGMLRLNRDTLVEGIWQGQFSQGYAIEEITAELASIALLQGAGIDWAFRMEQSASYISYFRGNLGTNPKTLDRKIRRAIDQAVEAIEYLSTINTGGRS